MKLKKIAHVPEAVLEFTRREAHWLSARALDHYDSTCKSFAQPGGAIYAMINAMDRDDVVVRQLTGYEVDILAKICEERHFETQDSRDMANHINAGLRVTLHHMIERTADVAVTTRTA